MGDMALGGAEGSTVAVRCGGGFHGFRVRASSGDAQILGMFNQEMLARINL